MMMFLLYEDRKFLILLNLEEERIKWPERAKRPFVFSSLSTTAMKELGETIVKASGKPCDFKTEGYIFLVLNSFYCFFVFLILGKT